MKTRSNSKNGVKGTRRSYSKSDSKTSNKYTQQRIVIMFLQMLNTIKLYHWKTSSYAQHKATDALYSNLNGHIDTFVEVMLGKKKNGSIESSNQNHNPNLRIDLLGVRSIPLKDFKHVNHFLVEVQKFKQFLLSFEKMKFMKEKEMSNQDLFTIRDEMLADVNQFLYLSTLA